MENIFRKEVEDNKVLPGTKWFLISYDAGEKITKREKNGRFEWETFLLGHKHTEDDFRKKIIRTLKAGEVKMMGEVAETVILFKDDRVALSDEKKRDFWDKEFKAYGPEFFFAIVGIQIDSSGVLLASMFPNEKLLEGFQKLIEDVE